MHSDDVCEDEGLVLFDNIRTCEQRKFLLASSSDFGALLSGYENELLSFKAPSQKSSGLLVSDSEKSDYDWLLTPPGTPLVPSLDRKAPVGNHAYQRGVFSQSTLPSTTLRLSSSEDIFSRAYGGVLGPHSLSNVSSTSSMPAVGASRGRPSSPSARARPILRSSSSCGPTQSRKSSTSLTSLHKPPSSGSRRAGQSQGKSLSPKPHSFELPIPGFSEPFLTDLPDCAHESHAGAHQGISRQSPTKSGVECSRPLTSTYQRWTHSTDQCPKSPARKRFTPTSCDATLNSTMTSSNLEIAETTRRPNGASGRNISLAKRRTKISPRRQLDSQVAHQPSSECKFRPLLSSVPAISFYGASESSSLLPLAALASNGCVDCDTKPVVQEKDGKEEDMHCESDFGDNLFLGDPEIYVGAISVQCSGEDNGKAADTDVENFGDGAHNFDMSSFQKQCYTETSSMMFHDGTCKLEKSVKISPRSYDANGCSGSSLADGHTERSLGLHDVEITISREITTKPVVSVASEKSCACQQKDSQRSSQTSILMEIADIGLIPISAIGTEREVFNADGEVFNADGLLLREQAQEEENHDHRDTPFAIGLCMGKMISDKEDQDPHESANLRSSKEELVHDDCTCAATNAVYRDERDGKGARLYDTSRLLLKRNAIFEEATDTILFCSSIIQELVYMAASIAIEAEKENERPVSRSEIVALFGFSEAHHYKNQRKKNKSKERCTTSQQTLSRVQRMMHQQTKALTLHHRSIERFENAVIGDNKELSLSTTEMATRRLTKKGKKITCKCTCCVM